MGPDLIALQRHWVDHAIAYLVTINWLRPGMRSTELVGHDNAVALVRKGERCVLCPGITDAKSAASFGHEVAHHAIWGKVAGKLEIEAAAWRWCREHTPCPWWNDEAQQCMTAALATYTRAAERDGFNALAVMEIEILCSDLEYKREIVRRRQLAIAEERQHYEESIRGRTCERCHAQRPRRATAARCASAVAQESSDRALDRKIASMRARVDAMRRAGNTKTKGDESVRNIQCFRNERNPFRLFQWRQTSIQTCNVTGNRSVLSRRDAMPRARSSRPSWKNSAA